LSYSSSSWMVAVSLSPSLYVRTTASPYHMYQLEPVPYSDNKYGSDFTPPTVSSLAITQFRRPQSRQTHTESIHRCPPQRYIHSSGIRDAYSIWSGGSCRLGVVRSWCWAPGFCGLNISVADCMKRLLASKPELVWIAKPVRKLAIKSYPEIEE